MINQSLQKCEQHRDDKDAKLSRRHIAWGVSPWRPRPTGELPSDPTTLLRFLRTSAQRQHRLACVLATLVLCGIARGAAGQEIERYFSLGAPGYGTTPGVTVLSRPRPAYEPAGIRVGDFIIYGNAAEAVGYDSNPTGEPQARPSLLQQTEAAVRVQSDWGRNSLYLTGGVNNWRYPAQPQQSITDWNTKLGGTYDIGRDQLALDISHITAAETPRDLNNPLLTAPVPYSVNTGRVGYTLQFGQFALIPGVEFDAWRYNNAEQDGVPVVLNYQSRNTVTGSLVGRYQASDRRSLLVIVRGMHDHFVTPLPDLPNRDYDGVDVLVGVEYDTGGVWRYRALVGYQTRLYASSAFQTLSGPTAEANVIWQPTGLTTVTASALHTIAESPLTINTSYTLTQGRVTIDHELRRNVLLQARAEIDTAVYPQNAGHATLWTAGFSATWLMNRRLRLVASYDYSTRLSGASSYVENVALLRLGFAL
jgi:hypothetical protein